MSFIAVKWIAIGSHFINFISILTDISQWLTTVIYIYGVGEKMNLSNINTKIIGVNEHQWIVQRTKPYNAIKSRRYERHGNRHTKKAEIIIIVLTLQYYMSITVCV